MEAAAQGIFGVSAKDLSVPQAAFIAGLPQSPIVYSPYAADGSLKSKENLELGLARAKDVLFNMYRTGVLSEKDYETYAALVKELREENARLREELAQKAQETPQTSPIASTATQEYPQVTTATNFDILKRLNRLEKEVFGKQIVDLSLIHI